MGCFIYGKLPTINICTLVCLPGTVYILKGTLCSKGLRIRDAGGASMLGRFLYSNFIHSVKLKYVVWDVFG